LVTFMVTKLVCIRVFMKNVGIQKYILVIFPAVVCGFAAR